MGPAKPRFKSVAITDMFTVESGQYHNASSLEKGDDPLISCGDTNNGLNRFVQAPPSARKYSDSLTVAYNGQPFTAKFHPYPFVTKDDVAVCRSDSGIPLETVIFAGVMFNLERWRYSYGRKCFREKLCRSSIPMPVTESGQIAHDWIRDLVTRHPYWNYFHDQLAGV